MTPPPTNPPRPPPPVLWSSPHLWLLPWWPGLTSPLPEVLHAHSESCVWCHQNCSLASRSSAREREREKWDDRGGAVICLDVCVCVVHLIDWGFYTGFEHNPLKHHQRDCFSVLSCRLYSTARVVPRDSSDVTRPTPGLVQNVKAFWGSDCSCHGNRPFSSPWPLKGGEEFEWNLLVRTIR